MCARARALTEFMVIQSPNDGHASGQNGARCSMRARGRADVCGILTRANIQPARLVGARNTRVLNNTHAHTHNTKRNGSIRANARTNERMLSSALRPTVIRRRYRARILLACDRMYTHIMFCVDQAHMHTHIQSSTRASMSRHANAHAGSSGNDDGATTREANDEVNQAVVAHTHIFAPFTFVSVFSQSRHTAPQQERNETETARTPEK